MVDYVSDGTALVRKFRHWAFTADLNDGLADKLQTIPGNDADIATTAPEIMYAHFDELDDAGRRIMAEMFLHGNEKGWTTFAGGLKGTDNRAEQIVEQVGRELGDRGAIQPLPVEEWPAPQSNRRSGTDWRGPADAPSPPAVIGTGAQAASVLE